MLFTGVAFGQHRHGGYVYRRPPIVVVRPAPIYGYGWYPYGYPYGYYPTVIIGTKSADVPCKKETLKDTDGNKHDVLICKQPDGSFQVVADGNSQK